MAAYFDHMQALAKLVQEHIHLANAPPDSRPTSMRHVAQGQAAYDKYSAERDPAIKMLSNYFGKEVGGGLPALFWGLGFRV